MSEDTEAQKEYEQNKLQHVRVRALSNPNYVNVNGKIKKRGELTSIERAMLKQWEMQEAQRIEQEKQRLLNQNIIKSI